MRMLETERVVMVFFSPHNNPGGQDKATPHDKNENGLRNVY